MFKNKITLLDSNWSIIEVYKSNFKPSVGEFIYSEKNNTYYCVINVIHSLKEGFNLILEVNPVKLDKSLKLNGQKLVSE